MDFLVGQFALPTSLIRSHHFVSYFIFEEENVRYLFIHNSTLPRSMLEPAALEVDVVDVYLGTYLTDRPRFILPLLQR